jgi:hypothetical protein
MADLENIRIIILYLVLGEGSISCYQPRGSEAKRRAPIGEILSRLIGEILNVTPWFARAVGRLRPGLSRVSRAKTRW